MPQDTIMHLLFYLPDADFITGIGIQYGTLGAGAVIEPVKDAGSAKVISTLGVY